MKTTLFGNRTCVTFTFQLKGSNHVRLSNKITEICIKYNAQQHIYSNVSPYRYDKRGNVIGEQLGSSGGTVTFHSHSCNHRKAAAELIELMEANGLKNSFFEEVIRTHRENDGTPYKVPQTFIEPYNQLSIY
jgi:hypothetical protein